MTGERGRHVGIVAVDESGSVPMYRAWCMWCRWISRPYRTTEPAQADADEHERIAPTREEDN